MYGCVWTCIHPIGICGRWVEVGYGGSVTDFSEFEPVGRITVDDRRRVPLGQTDTKPGSRYSLWQHPDGSILLRPLRNAIAGKAVTFRSSSKSTSDLVPGLESGSDELSAGGTGSPAPHAGKPDSSVENR